MEPTGESEGAGARSAVVESATVSRSQNLVHLLPQDWSMIGQVLAPSLERVEPDVAATQVLVLTHDPASSLAVADAVLQRQPGDSAWSILPVTSVRRAARLSSERAPLVLAATPADAAELIANSALKLDQLRTVALAWLDEVLEDPTASQSLEAVMAEIPKTAARVLIASTPSPALDAFVERYMRRARRLEDQPLGEPLSRPVEFVASPPGGRPGALRRLLDEMDPASTVIRVRTPQGSEEARHTLHRLGYASREAVRVVDASEPADAELVVLYELPERRDELRAVVEGTEGRVVALVEPRQVVTLRRVAGAASAQPFALAAEPRRARERQARLLGSLEARLTTERFDRELLALEPLLGAYDGLEVAAALLRMLDDEQERSESRVLEVLSNASLMVSPAEAEPAVQTGAPEPAPAWVRVFINVGERDGASPGDLVGAITGEAGVKRDVIGKIDLRENFSIVEIGSDVADAVIERLGGANIRGRRVQARRDRDEGGSGRPERGRSSGGDRGGRGFDRGGRSFDRPVRSFDRGSRGGDRGFERPSRSFDRGDRADRSGRGERSGGFDRGERSGGPDRGGRSFDRGDRGGRSFDRDDRGGRSFDRGDRAPRRFGGDREDRGGRGGGFGGRDRDRGYGRTQDDERQEWRQRGERLRNSRGGGFRADRQGRDREDDQR